MSNIEELQYGECCCCLKKGDHRQLTKQSYLDVYPEIYEVIFKNTFDIVLSYPENTKLICDICIVKLKEANHFRTMVESSQQSLCDRVNWQPEFVNVKEEQLELELNTNSIKYDSDNQMEEADNDVRQFACTMKELNYNAQEVKENLVVGEPSEQINTGAIKGESNGYMEVVYTADYPNIQDNSETSTSSCDKLAITRYKIKPLKVLLTRSPIAEKRLSYDSNCQYKQLAAPLHSQCKNKRFVCDFCPYKTAYKVHLKVHLRIHTGEKPFSCDKCQYKTAREGDLKVHLRTHTGEKPFSCNICQYKTTLIGNLKMHLRTHSGEKPFSCEKCPYKTAREADLKVHFRTHTRENPFSCKICKYKTSRKENLKVHLRAHTGEKPFCCNICQYRTVRKGDLVKHFLTHNKKSHCVTVPSSN